MFPNWALLAKPLFFAAGGFVCSALGGWFLFGSDPFFWKRNHALAGIGLAFGIAVAVHYRLMPTGRLNES